MDNRSEREKRAEAVWLKACDEWHREQDRALARYLRTGDDTYDGSQTLAFRAVVAAKRAWDDVLDEENPARRYSREPTESAARTSAEHAWLKRPERMRR